MILATFLVYLTPPHPTPLPCPVLLCTVGIMTGDFRDFVSKIRCVCLVDEYDNMVSVEKTSPLFQQPILTAHFEDPDDDEDEVEDEGEGETDIKGSKGKSSKRHGKRKRGDKAASQEPDEAVLDRLVLICAIHCSAMGHRVLLVFMSTSLP